MPTRTRKSPAQRGRRPAFAESSAIRQQLEQLEMLHGTLNAVDSQLLALVATYRPSLLKKRRFIKTLAAGRGTRMSLPRKKNKERRASPGGKEDAAKKVWIYIDASRQIGDPDHLKVFTSQAAADGWLEDHGPEGVIVAYPVMRNGRIIHPPAP